MIKIGDTAVSEEKVVETTSLNSPKEKEKSDDEKKSTSTKKAKSTSQSRGTARAKLIKKQEKKKLVFLKKIFTLFLLNVKLPEILVFLQELWQISD